jgi:prepilin-type N-terminal cleavage/methylation domain-containing protein
MTRRGTTLVELLVTVVVLGIIWSVATLALRSAPALKRTDQASTIADTLNTVIESGLPATLELIVDAQPALATLSPDGTVVADSALHVDRLTGRPNAR